MTDAALRLAIAALLLGGCGGEVLGSAADGGPDALADSSAVDQAPPAADAAADLAEAAGPDLATPGIGTPQKSGTTQDLVAVWGSSSTDIYASGVNGTLIHSSDGTTWSRDSAALAALPTSMRNHTLSGIWGDPSAGEVYVVGSGDPVANVDSPILHLKGGTWAIEASNTTSDLNAIWGSSASDVYVVGSNGLVLHSSGTGTWTAQASGITKTLTAVWGSSTSDIYAVGYLGALVHSTGDGTWTTASVDPSLYLFGVWGADAEDLFAVGAGPGGAGVILQSSDGKSWTMSSYAWSGLINDVRGGSATSAYAAVADGLLHWDGSNWSSVPTRAAPLLAIWIDGSNDLYGVGTSGTIVRVP